MGGFTFLRMFGDAFPMTISRRPAEFGSAAYFGKTWPFTRAWRSTQATRMP